MSRSGLGNFLAGLSNPFPPRDLDEGLLYFNPITNQFEILGIGSGLDIAGGNLIATGGGGGGAVESVTGLDTDNSDPLNPIINISVDGVSITGSGTPADPLVSVGGGGGYGAPVLLTTTTTISNGTTYKCYTNEGAAALVPVTLPTAVAGLELRFIVADADGFQVIAAAGDTIRYYTLLSGVAGYVESLQIGATITLYAINATTWIVVASTGDWDVN